MLYNIYIYTHTYTHTHGHGFNTYDLRITGVELVEAR